MQKISLFQLFILGVHLILESCNQIDHTQFWFISTEKFINQNWKWMVSSSLCSWNEEAELKEVFQKSIFRNDFVLVQFWSLSVAKRNF